MRRAGVARNRICLRSARPCRAAYHPLRLFSNISQAVCNAYSARSRRARDHRTGGHSAGPQGLQLGQVGQSRPSELKRLTKVVSHAQQASSSNKSQYGLVDPDFGPSLGGSARGWIRLRSAANSTLHGRVKVTQLESPCRRASGCRLEGCSASNSGSASLGSSCCQRTCTAACLSLSCSTETSRA